MGRLRVLFFLALLLLSLALSLVFAASGEQLEGRIVFASDRGGNWDIWIMNADGSNLRRLTSSLEPEVDPRFSPDGRQILFSTKRGERHEVWVMDADGKGQRKITDGDQADWSPDGQSIVFRRNWQIVTRHLARGKEKVVSPPLWRHCVSPAWSPDGKKIAFAARLLAGYSIYVVYLASGKCHRVIGERGACEPHWSPDGSKIAYQTETHIFTIRPDGKDKRQVTVHAGIQHYPEWSPDGKKIVYCQGPSPDGPWQLYLISAQGGTPVQLLGEGSSMNPDWSQ
ncbi:MAG TPA: hypothetical protein EYP85_05840 [Armatimonadetes bacterium]|nr:hypothetical protein [Armatimonadota bacterium]